VLVATDIAARGIDVTALGHVVNFDVPHVADDYIHRVGRTARADTTGSAFTLVSQEEEGDLREIEKAIASRLPRVTLPDFDYHARPQANLDHRPPRPHRDPRRPPSHGSRGPGGGHPARGPGGGPPSRGPQQRRWSGAPRRRP
jgi:superfamily II DNA/RNA helicase